MKTTDETNPFPTKICDQVEKTMRQRKAFGHHSDTNSETDFMIGAMVAIQAFGYWPPPVNWVYAPLGGRSILEEELDYELEDI